jgi:hypothetical protein
MMLIFTHISNKKKRKAQPVIEISSSSSDSSEIVKAPVTPSKKYTRTTPPAPGTPEFDSLPAVSYKRSKLDTAMSTLPPGGTPRESMK